MAFTAERTSVVQNIQIGKETTLGTKASSFQKLASISVKMTPSIATNPFVPNGTMFSTVAPIGKDMTNLTFEASPIYAEMDWILGSVLCTASSGVYNPSATSTNTPDFYTIQSGQTGSCEEVCGIVWTGATFSINRDKFSITGTGIGQAMNFAPTWASGATAAATGTPIQPKDFSVTLGSQLTRCFSAELAITNRWKDVWVVDATKASYVNVVETLPSGTVKLRLEADTAGKAIITALRAGNTQQNLIIEAAPSGLDFKLDAYMLVSGVNELSDENGVYAFTIEGVVAYNAAQGYAIKATLDSTP